MVKVRTEINILKIIDEVIEIKAKDETPLPVFLEEVKRLNKLKKKLK